MLKPIDEHYRDLAVQATDQCEALARQMDAVLDGEDEDGEPCGERLCGRSRRDGREALIFAEPGVRHQRQVVFVDAILELAALIRREHEAGGDA
jgi:hypothetical protein